MPKRTGQKISFSKQGRRKIEAFFEGGNISSDGGILLLRETDNRERLTAYVAKVLKDPRDPNRITHSLEQQVKQRIYGLGLGYEDLNDHQDLRHDIAFQTATESSKVLSSPSTLCRFERTADRETIIKLHEVLFEKFVNSFKKSPKALTLDFDATDDPVHGEQENRFFHGYYGHYCFLPLYVFCGKQLLVSYLRPSNIDGAKHAWAILSLLVKQLRKHWADVKITFRGDGGFCRHKMLSWCERHDVDYIIGIAKNTRLTEKSKDLCELAKKTYEESQEKQRLFCDFHYAAKTWKKRERRIIVKAEYTEKGANTRFIITTLDGEPQALYDEIYCARGEMENRIKEQQMDLFADRTSCTDWWANQFRLMLSSFAYVLVETLRRVYLEGTELAQAQVGTIRLKLLKIGAVIIRNTRRVQFLLASHYPFQDLFVKLAARLIPG